MCLRAHRCCCCCCCYLQAVAGRQPTISNAQTEQLPVPFKGLLAKEFPAAVQMPLQRRVSVFKDGERLGEQFLQLRCEVATCIMW
jgi:hypothetical protein